MNPEEEHELQMLEERLRELSPREPGARLTERVFAAFDAPADAAPAAVDAITPMPTPASWLQPIAAAAAVAVIAGVVAIIGLNRPDSRDSRNKSIAANRKVKEAPAIGGDTRTTPVVHEFVPDRAQNTFQGSKVDKVFFTEDRRPVQAVRYQFVETYIWKNPADGSLVELRVPVERIRYVPVPTD